MSDTGFVRLLDQIHYWYAKWYTDMYPLVSLKNGKKKKKEYRLVPKHMYS